ncbi:hypothetical protein GCM10010168_25280 [Actinoplanes ianthinogenes]|uniref:Uncharacterized protein n=1 Tax=Actinoplanes ianthinogenes TaxID=122358 RepID=A0ABN6CSE0_9ACTN|nr:hypothetical protein [Actinoplanes ianthinogenes]BCJ48168.1 hypothetical protein Aiant_88250 [Actinoplanes ianthinogenes]GGR06925.1 hypothetical protein GCM10010168_25280 [Actinoplanes ianthinogenes]
MSADKVDPAILRLEGDRGVPVVIELHPVPVEQVSASQAGVLEHLDRSGVSGARGLTLANAVLATLSRDQVLDVAARPDVRKILLNEPQQVL